MTAQYLISHQWSCFVTGGSPFFASTFWDVAMLKVEKRWERRFTAALRNCGHLFLETARHWAGDLGRACDITCSSWTMTLSDFNFQQAFNKKTEAQEQIFAPVKEETPFVGYRLRVIFQVKKTDLTNRIRSIPSGIDCVIYQHAAALRFCLRQVATY